MRKNPVRAFKFLTAATLLTLIAACEETPGTPAPDASAAPAAAAAASGEARISMAECATPSNGRVHVRVASSVLSVPATIIRDTLPANMQGPLSKEAVEAELRRRVGEGAGCPEKPMNAALLVVQDDLGHPLLEGTMGLIQGQGGAVTGPFSEVTRQLQQAPNRNCKTLNGELLACVGTETRGDHQTEVMYVISTDTSQVMNTGGPLAARCVLQENGIRGCNLVDHFGDITFDATLNAGEYTTAGLRSARQAALARLQALKL